MINKFLNRLVNTAILGKRKVRIGLYAILAIVLCMTTYFTYDEHRMTIVSQQQEHMLEISEAISQSIQIYINGIQDSLKVITLDNDFIKGDKANNIERLKSYYESESKFIEAVYLLSENGEIIEQYPRGIESINTKLKDEISKVINKKQSYIGEVYLDKSKNQFLINIYDPIFHGDQVKGVAAISMSLDRIYDTLIDPVKIGKRGYAMVKDQEGTIIMHPVKEQVGMDVIESRKEVHPELEFEELEDLISNQLTGNKGTAVYHSYWWGDNVLKRVKKLNAYAPVKLGEYFWVVALTMSYDEIQGPINRFLIKIIIIAALIAVIIYIFTSKIFRLKRNKDKLEKETKYLKVLNETSENLRKKEAELYHSHKLKMIGTLAGGIAHDINNLLTPILGYSELLLIRMDETNEYYDEIEEIFKASQKGKDLIQQILAFSRHENGIVKIERININNVVDEAIKLLKAILPKDISIKKIIKDNCIYINGNFTQIHQIIFNLCINAYQAIGDSRGEIKINVDTISGLEIKDFCKSVHKERDYVEITIEDTGCGMDEERKNRIFDPFFTTKTIGEGTGLGLFVVQNIIDKYQGAITVESQVGIGTSFRVYLPLISESEEITYSNIPKKQVQDNKRILVVDDNERIIKVLKKALEHLGYKVISETNSIKALEKFKSNHNKIDLVITDYIMPNMKGDKFATKVKEIESNVGVILMTGYMDEESSHIETDQYIDGRISKPIELSELSDTVEKVLTIINN